MPSWRREFNNCSMWFSQPTMKSKRRLRKLRRTIFSRSADYQPSRPLATKQHTNSCFLTCSSGSTGFHNQVLRRRDKRDTKFPLTQRATARHMFGRRR